MTTPSRLVFFGTELFSVPTLEALIAADYDVVAIVTKPDTTRGRGRKAFVHPIKQIGIAHNIPILQPEKLLDIEDDLRALNAQCAVLVSYGKLVPKRILNVFEPLGIINIHPSRLPEFRGPSPIEATILSGQKETAVSIMKLDEGMDTGPVFFQEAISLTGDETKPELSEKLSRVGAAALLKVLPDILSGALQPEPQQNFDVSVTSLISKVDGVLNPTTDDASTLERKIRAYQGYPKPHLKVLGNDVIVTSARIVSTPNEQALVIPCAKSSWLEVTTLVGPSGRTMTGVDFMRGYSHHT